MSLAGWRFLLFGLAGAAAIVLLASIGVPGGRRESVDRFTGERIYVVRSAADAYHEARREGEATKALERLRTRLEAYGDDATLRQLAAILEAELSAPGSPPPAGHPDGEVVRADCAEAARQRASLPRHTATHLAPDGLPALLRALEADGAVAAATEAYFEPLARWTADPPEHHADARVAHLQAAVGPLDPRRYLELASCFRAQRRPRAQLRWLLRAYAVAPGDPEVREALQAGYLEHGRLVEALLVTGGALRLEGESAGLWETRARIAGWLSMRAEEAEAREALLVFRDDPAIRHRLVELYSYLGRPRDALRHARVLAAGSDDPVVLERPARLALEAGDVDLALGLLEELAQGTGDVVHWRERIIEYAYQDARVERVIRELILLRERCPDGDYESRIESLYRRRNMRERLVTLLEQRLEREPDDCDLAREVIALHLALGNRERLRAVVTRQVEHATDARTFFDQVRNYHALDVPGLVARARELACSPQLGEDDVAFVLGQLEPLYAEDAWREVASLFARRFPASPRARATLIALVDHEPTDAERAAAAERVAGLLPDEPALVRAWVERATWAGDVDGQIRAREALLRHDPGDAENRRALAWLYGDAGRAADAAAQWRKLAEAEGLGSEAALHLADALFAQGELEEAMALLERRATRPDTTNAERIAVADQLFGNGHQDRALRFYLAALGEQPDDAHALLRAGQIRAWTNDPRGAIPHLQRRLAVSAESTAEVRFYLGEAHWALQEEPTARRQHERCLAELQELSPRTTMHEVMRAKVLARLGRADEACAAFEQVLRTAPDNVELALDYVDALIGMRDLARAREVTDHALALSPDLQRARRADGQVALLEGRYEEAAALLAACSERYGPDAGTEAERARAHELAGSWRSAREAYGHAWALQPENRDIEESLLRLADSLATQVHGALELRRAGDDTVLRTLLAGSTLLGGERTRLSASVGSGTYRGHAAAVNDGATELEETVGLLTLAVQHRFLRQDIVAAGLEAFPGAPGDAPVGGWFGGALRASEPYRTVGARVHLHTLWEDPAAAVSLGGRTSGARLFAHRDLGKRLWGGVELAYDLLSLDLPAGGGAEDGRFRGTATLGLRLTPGQTRVGEELRIGRSILPGLVGPDVAGDPGRTLGPLVNVWLAYEAIRLLDDRELATILPIGLDFDYVSVGGRADLHLAPGLGAMLEGYAGLELGESDPFFGFHAGLSWRPSRRFELTWLGGYGQPLGRAGDDVAFRLHFHLAYRW